MQNLVAWISRRIAPIVETTDQIRRIDRSSLMDLLQTRVQFSGWRCCASFSLACAGCRRLNSRRLELSQSVTRWDSAVTIALFTRHDADRPVRCSVVSHTLGAQPVRADCIAPQGGAQQPEGLPLRSDFALHEVFRHNVTMLLLQRGVVIGVLLQIW